MIKNKKYRKTPNETLYKVCLFSNCSNFAKRNNYCLNHINNTDSTSPNRIEQTKSRKELAVIKGNESIHLGDNAEEYICEILKSFDNIACTERIGYVRGKLDIIYKCLHDNSFRGIQVKSLVKSKHKDSYFCKIRKNNYDKNTLIVGINKQCDRFILFYYNNIIK